MPDIDTTMKRLRTGSIGRLPKDPLDYILERDLVAKTGLWLEFGVYKGTTIRRIAKYRSDPGAIYGFDSFEGLPEDWDREHRGWWSDKGAFSLDGQLPSVPEHVTLVPGWFDESLPKFLAEVPGEVTLLHVDCDLYSSTAVVLTALKDRLADRCVVVFDEMFNYPGWERNEAKAFLEFLDASPDEWDFTWVGMVGEVETEPKGNNAATQSAAMILRRKRQGIDYDVVFGSFFTANYRAPNERMVASYEAANAASAYRSKIEAAFLAEEEYATEGVRSFQKGNTIKIRLLNDCLERHLNSGTILVYTDSDAVFPGRIDEAVQAFLDLDVDVAFQRQSEGIHNMDAFLKRWRIDACIGFIICHATETVLNFFRECEAICDLHRRENRIDNASQTPTTTGWDQMIVNEMLADKPDFLKWDLLDVAVVGKRGTVFAHDWNIDPPEIRAPKG